MCIRDRYCRAHDRNRRQLRFITASIFLPGHQHGYHLRLYQHTLYILAYFVPDDTDNHDVYRRLRRLHIGINQGHQGDRHAQADLEGMYTTHTPPLSSRREKMCIRDRCNICRVKRIRFTHSNNFAASCRKMHIKSKEPNHRTHCR